MAFHPWLTRCSRNTLSPPMGTPVFALNIIENTYEYYDPGEQRENQLRYEIAIYLRAAKPGIDGAELRKMVAGIVAASSPRLSGDIRDKRERLLAKAKEEGGKDGPDYERLRDFVETNINSLAEMSEIDNTFPMYARGCWTTKTPYPHPIYPSPPSAPKGTFSASPPMTRCRPSSSASTPRSGSSRL
jgi:hypothetical protein